MTLFKARTKFDRIFEIGIFLKGLDGLIEVAGGTLLALVRPEQINRVVNFFTAEDLSKNSHNFIASHLVHWSQHLSSGALAFGAVYLLAHGISKLILVVEILRNHLWAYLGLIVLTAAFIVYQTYEIYYSHSISLVLLTLFDAVIVYLTVREYKKQLEAHKNPS